MNIYGGNDLIQGQINDLNISSAQTDAVFKSSWVFSGLFIVIQFSKPFLVSLYGLNHLISKDDSWLERKPPLASKDCFDVYGSKM